MSEGDWSSEGRTLASPKRKVPLWVWGCGGGCALFLLVAVVLGVFGFRFVRKAVDPELNWAAIDEVLPVAERPEGYTVFGFPMRLDGVRMWFLEAADSSHQVVLMHAEPGEAASDARGEMLRSGGQGFESSALTVQGRELTVLRYDTGAAAQSAKGPMQEMMKEFAVGAHANVDLTPPGSDELLLLMYIERGKDARVDDEELVEILSHFRLPAALAAPETAPAGTGEDEE